MRSRSQDPDPRALAAPTILIAGGASAAARARRVNEQARILIFERDAHISFANCGQPDYIGGEITDRDQLLGANPRLFYDRFRIEARVRHEVVTIDRAAKSVRVRDLETGEVYEEPYDKLILSPGATPLVPPIPGVEARGVFTLRNIEDMDRIVAALPGISRAVVVGPAISVWRRPSSSSAKGSESPWWSCGIR